MGYLPIQDHGVIGNLRTAALVGSEGTIDWLCLPSFDSPSVFASILDDERGGRFSLRPAEYAHSQQLYLPDTNVLLTRFLSPRGIAELLDYMPLDREIRERASLVREVRVVKGELTFEAECLPAFDYARAEHSVDLVRNGAVFEGPDMGLGLATDAPLREGPNRGALSQFTLKQGQSATFALQQLNKGEGLRKALSGTEQRRARQETLSYWRSWISRSTYRGRWREMVERSALTLKLLSHEPTGAIVASPTMGLPESIGGERNWDYRYTWLRDASFTVYALIALGFRREANDFMGWLFDRCRAVGGQLRPVYGVDGRAELAEKELTHLDGYMGSRPVRVGNAAHDGFELDPYGAVLDAVYLHNKHVQPLNYDLWEEVKQTLEWLSASWRAEDTGMWEIRGQAQHFVSSKVMSWVALERAVRVARQRGLPAEAERWIEQRDAIYEEVMEQG